MNLIKKMWRDQSGQGMVEYGLIIALVAVVAIGALTLLGPQLRVIFNGILTALGGTPAP